MFPEHGTKKLGKLKFIVLPSRQHYTLRWYCSLIYYVKRLLNDPLKISIIVFLLFLPFCENIFYIYNFFKYKDVVDPAFSCFLAGSSVGVGHILQGILLWFAPLYFLILLSEDCLQDYKTGNINSLITKLGIKKYIIINLIKSFTVSFIIVFISLAVNILTTYAFFYGGTASKVDFNVQGQGFYQYSISHPLLINIVYILLTCLIIALVSMTGTALTITLKDRKLIYPIVMFFWYIACSIPDSIIYVTQPFTEYGLDVSAKSLIIFTVINLATVILLSIREIKYVKKKIL